MVGFPLLLIPLAVYNIIAFLMPSVSFDAVLFQVPMMTGQPWPVTLNDILLALGIVLLLLEVVKGSRPGSKFLMDHLLSLIVFGAAAAEFVMWPKFGTSTFFLLALLAMADFFGGIAQRTRRRVVYADAEPAPRKARRRAADDVADEPVEAPRPVEPRVEPAVPAPAPVAAPVAVPASQPTPPAVAAQSVAESVLMDPPVLKPSAASEVSPQLQPSNGTSASPDQPQRSG